MNCSMPGFSVLHYLPEFAQTQVHWVHDAIQPFHPLMSPSLLALNLSQHQRSLPVSWLFASGGQTIGVSTSASVLPMNIQGRFPLGLTGLISLQSKELSRVFSSTTIQKHQLGKKVLKCWIIGDKFYQCWYFHEMDSYTNNNFIFSESLITLKNVFSILVYIYIYI